MRLYTCLNHVILHVPLSLWSKVLVEGNLFAVSDNVDVP